MRICSTRIRHNTSRIPTTLSLTIRIRIRIRILTNHQRHHIPSTIIPPRLCPRRPRRRPHPSLTSLSRLPRLPQHTQRIPRDLLAPTRLTPARRPYLLARIPTCRSHAMLATFPTSNSRMATIVLLRQA